MQLYITRHGQTDWNILKKVMGKSDKSLNQTGIEQANITKNNLKNLKIDLIISSPLKRAKQTAKIINEALKVKIIYDARIAERDFGEFEGMQTENFDFWEFWDYYKNIQYIKAENIQEFFQRIYKFLDDITLKYKDKNILLVTHSGVSIPIACYFNKSIPHIPLVEANLALGNCEVTSYHVN